MERVVIYSASASNFSTFPFVFFRKTNTPINKKRLTKEKQKKREKKNIKIEAQNERKTICIERIEWEKNCNPSVERFGSGAAKVQIKPIKLCTVRRRFVHLWVHAIATNTIKTTLCRFLWSKWPSLPSSHFLNSKNRDFVLALLISNSFIFPPYLSLSLTHSTDSPLLRDQTELHVSFGKAFSMSGVVKPTTNWIYSKTNSNWEKYIYLYSAKVLFSLNHQRIKRLLNKRKKNRQKPNSTASTTVPEKRKE